MDAREMGRRGGASRAKKLSPERRREIASEGGKASKKARKEKAERKQKHGTAK